MPSPPASLFSAVHPFQIELQEFGSYGLIVDARAPGAFEDDHLPGAVNVPYEPVASKSGGSATQSMPDALRNHVARLSAGDTILVYCDRGGLDAQAYAQPLRDAGWTVDVLAGGWGTYRRWVAAGLEVLPRSLVFRRFVAPPISGLCLLLALLREQGEQVLDLPELAGQRLVPGLTLVGDNVPTQNAFDTRLLDALRRFDPQRAVWVRSGLDLPSGLELPAALHEALSRADSIRVEMPIDQRARMWFERIRSMGLPIEELLRSLSKRAGVEHGRGLDGWMEMLGAGRATEALSEVIGDCLDPDCSAGDGVAAIVHLPSPDRDQVAQRVRDLVRAHPSARVGR